MNIEDYENNDTPEGQARAWTMLWSLNSMQAHLFLRHSGAQGLSMLIDVDPDKKTLMVDALRDVPAPDRIGAPMRIEAQIDGRLVEIGCAFQSVVRLPDGPAWLATKPRLVLDTERRQVYRLRIPTRSAFAVLVAGEDPAMLEGRLLDLSRYGFAISLPGALQVEIDTVVECQLQLPGGIFVCKGNIRDSSPTVETSRFGIARERTRLGLAFVGLEHRAVAQLSRNVGQIERELLRNFPQTARRRRR